MQRPRARGEGRELENFLVSSQNGLFRSGGCGRAGNQEVSSWFHPALTASPSLSSVSGTAGGKNDAVSMLIYLFHLGFPLKAFYGLSTLFLRLYMIAQI